MKRLILIEMEFPDMGDADNIAWQNCEAITEVFDSIVGLTGFAMSTATAHVRGDIETVRRALDVVVEGARSHVHWEEFEQMAQDLDQ